MLAALRMKEKKPTLPSHHKKTYRELSGSFFAAIVAVCYEFLSWLASFRAEQN
jgi:hypothetical protein